MKFRSFVRI